VLDSFQEDAITRLSGKLLNKITGNSIDQLIRTLKIGGLSSQAQEHTLSLLASLAIDSESSDKIVAQGGVAAIIGGFESMISARAVEATAKTICRLASSQQNIQELVNGGAGMSCVARNLVD
jgi:hypothetical protein